MLFNAFVEKYTSFLGVHAGSYFPSGDHQMEVKGHPLLLFIFFV